MLCLQVWAGGSQLSGLRGSSQSLLSHPPTAGETAQHSGVCLLHGVERCPEKALGAGWGFRELGLAELVGAWDCSARASRVLQGCETYPGLFG